MRAKPPRFVASSDLILNLNTIGYSYTKKKYGMVVVLEGARGLKGVQYPIPEKSKGVRSRQLLSIPELRSAVN
jgi:hypothetical protein